MRVYLAEVVHAGIRPAVVHKVLVEPEGKVGDALHAVNKVKVDLPHDLRRRKVAVVVLGGGVLGEQNYLHAVLAVLESRRPHRLKVVEDLHVVFSVRPEDILVVAYIVRVYLRTQSIYVLFVARRAERFGAYRDGIEVYHHRAPGIEAVDGGGYHAEAREELFGRLVGDEVAAQVVISAVIGYDLADDLVNAFLSEARGRVNEIVYPPVP